ncbi:unnamed protein product [Toxocara canis]|uniref:Uncharacterized protein n=1 Tax=Toxocara canis TaxID=6265 RepID=A0A3P7F5U3_TOXCA|nr:unnamed protein product [Toxocara canis]
MPDDKTSSQRNMGLCRKMSHGSREVLERNLVARRREETGNTTNDSERLCLQSVGVLFSGTDVSYV